MDAKTQEAMRDVSRYIANHFTRERQKLLAFIKIYTAKMDAKPAFDCLFGAFLFGELLRLDLFTVRNRMIFLWKLSLLPNFFCNCSALRSSWPVLPAVGPALRIGFEEPVHRLMEICNVAFLSANRNFQFELSRAFCQVLVFILSNRLRYAGAERPYTHVRTCVT